MSGHGHREAVQEIADAIEDEERVGQRIERHAAGHALEVDRSASQDSACRHQLATQPPALAQCGRIGGEALDLLRDRVQRRPQPFEHELRPGFVEGIEAEEEPPSDRQHRQEFAHGSVESLLVDPHLGRLEQGVGAQRVERDHFPDHAPAQPGEDGERRRQA